MGPYLESAQHGFLHVVFRQIDLRRAQQPRQVCDDAARLSLRLRPPELPHFDRAAVLQVRMI